MTVKKWISEAYKALSEIESRPELPQKSLEELCDEYIALMGPYDRSEKDVTRLKLRLGKLMNKHGIRFIARKDTLLECEWVLPRCYTVNLLPLDRLGSDVFSENAKGAHLIPLVDRLLETDGSHERNKEARKKLATSLARAATAEEQSNDFVYQGYKFHWWYYKKSGGSVYTTRVTDLDG